MLPPHLSVGRDRVQQDVGRLGGDVGKIERGADGVQVKGGWAARNKNEVGGLGGGKGGGICIRGTVEDNQIGELSRCLL